MTAIRTRKLLSPLGILFLFTALATPAVGQQEPSAEELVKKTQNPVSDLISVPFQNNFNFGTGSKHRTVWVLNIQPVIPFHISENWNLIARVIMPVINQPSLFPGMSSATGLGDFNPTFFLAPAKPGLSLMTLIHPRRNVFVSAKVVLLKSMAASAPNIVLVTDSVGLVTQIKRVLFTVY